MVTRKQISAAAQRVAVAADVALIKAGAAAKQRQRGRALKTALKTSARAVAIVATAAATVMATRAVVRARRRRAATSTRT